MQTEMQKIVHRMIVTGKITLHTNVPRTWVYMRVMRDKRRKAGLSTQTGKPLKRAPNNGQSKDKAAYMRNWRLGIGVVKRV